MKDKYFIERRGWNNSGSEEVQFNEVGLMVYMTVHNVMLACLVCIIKVCNTSMYGI